MMVVQKKDDSLVEKSRRTIKASMDKLMSETTMSETTALVCSWRLKAKEIRTRAKGFSSSSAMQMENIACIWDRMADALEPSKKA
jgi:hypothetical protein